MSRPSRFAGIVPAAGRSRRFGSSHKLLAPFGATTVVGATLDALREGGIGPLVAVVRADDEELRDWMGMREERTAIHLHPERGMLSSIRVGLEALGGARRLASDGTALAVCPADLPALDADTVRRLRLHFESVGGGLVLPRHRGRRGHPLLVEPSLQPEIEELDPSVGLRQLLDRHPERLSVLDVDDAGAVRDVDTREDYEGIRGAGPDHERSR